MAFPSKFRRDLLSKTESVLMRGRGSILRSKLRLGKFSRSCFFKSEIISNIIKSAEQEKVELVSSDNANKEAEWICKNCYDVGEVLLK